MTKDVRDVIVVGAGPAGSTAAESIAKSGFDVLLIEREKRIGAHNSCGGGIGYFLKDLFSLPDELIKKEVSKVILQLGEKQTVYQANRPLYASVLRKEFDQFLATRANNAGAELLTETKAVDYDPYYKELTCFHRPTRTTVKYRANIVIFADGARTLAWKTCRAGLPHHKADIIGIARELHNPGHGLEAYEFHFDEVKLPYGYFWVFPKDETINVGVGGPLAQVGGRINDMMDRFLEKRPELKDLPAVSVTSGLIPGTLPSKLHAAGIMTIGDAGGFLNPLTGGGIFLGMKSAQYAAKTAVEALRANRFDSHFLAAYTHRVKFSSIYPAVKVFEGLVRGSETIREMTGRVMLGKVFKGYSDVMFHLLKVIKDVR